MCLLSVDGRFSKIWSHYIKYDDTILEIKGCGLLFVVISNKVSYIYLNDIIRLHEKLYIYIYMYINI